MGEWVAERDLEAEGVRLFCLPHAGSGAAGFYRWKRLLAPEVAVCPVMLPGREARLGEELVRTVGGIVEGVHGAVRDRLGERPYAIFGHSMGALVAFAWARRIADAGLPGPEWLFVSGRDAPGFGRAGELSGLSDEAFLAGLAVRYGRMALMEDAEVREVYLPILRADLECVEGFVAGGGLDCPVVAFAGDRDGSVSRAGMAAWGGVTSGSFAERWLPGDHFFHFGEGMPGVLAEIRGCLLAGGSGRAG